MIRILWCISTASCLNAGCHSLTDLSGRVGITQANLSKIKNNHINAIRFSTLAAICEALSCTPGDLLEYRP